MENKMKSLIYSVLIAAVLLFGNAVSAEPTVKEIYQTAQTDSARALVLIDQVIENRPNSSRAHFIRAEILLAMGKKSQARESFIRAERLDPTLRYALPETVDKLRTQLNVKPDSVLDNKTILMFALIAVLLVLVVWLLVRSKSQNKPYTLDSTSYRPMPPITPMTAGNNISQATATQSQTTPAVAPQAAQSGMRSNIMGGLATGLAVGAGIAAGSALANNLMNSKESGGTNASDTNTTSNVDQTQYVPSQDSSGDWGGDSGGGWIGDSGDSSEW
jgi:predicted negative regulator of RcsB-dependent stress response